MTAVFLCLCLLSAALYALGYRRGYDAAEDAAYWRGMRG